MIRSSSRSSDPRARGRVGRSESRGVASCLLSSAAFFVIDASGMAVGVIVGFLSVVLGSQHWVGHGLLGIVGPEVMFGEGSSCAAV